MTPNVPLLHVACGVLINAQGEVLIAQRPQGKIAAGKWEFPGGKVESGESARQALCRELHEELGIEVTGATPLMHFRHNYSDRHVRLEVFCVQTWCGLVQSREAQQLQWCVPAAARHLDILPTVSPILRALQMPAHYVFTPESGNAEALLNDLAQLPAGAWVRLRRPALNRDAYAALAGEFVGRCRTLGLKSILDRDAALVTMLNADGLHLAGAALAAFDDRPICADRWLAMSAHSPEDWPLARKLSVDCAVLSPVLATATHPQAQPLGWPRFAQWVRDSPVAVYALGGVGPECLEIARSYGAIGVAGIRAYWTDSWTDSWA